MPTNSFLPFGTAAGANVATAADYSANSGYAAGYQGGVAQSKFLNFTWRQSANMAAALGQVIVEQGNVDAPDDGNITNLKNALLLGLRGAAPGRVLAVRVFTASGTYNPTAGTKSIMVELVAGGGAGGGALAVGSGQTSAGSGGGAGGYARGYLTANFAGVSISVGAGGAGSSGAGAPGGATSFGGILGATGGGGGSLGSPAPSTTTTVVGGVGGGVGNGGNLINSQGGPGLYAIYSATPISGAGGASSFGAGAIAAVNTNTGNNAFTYGSGGSGGVLQGPFSSPAGGGNGAPGVIIITEFG